MYLFDTMTRTKREFIPIESNKVKMYVCGQTVYDYCHLGHARKAVVFDIIRKWFIAAGYEVLFVENITDIDDKIINRASSQNKNIIEFTNQYINYMHEDFDILGIMRPDIQPRATEYINQMLATIQNLVDKGFAYHAKNGDVYYSVNKFSDYGKLSGKNLEDLIAGERVEVDANKQNPLDFVLWKAAKEGEPYWDSEFGKGRPGWHIECSAMSESILGKNFDIHGGGQDLIFPHHENEIAQSEAHNDCVFANYWLHNGFLNIDDEKMSKSLGNFFTVREILDKYDAEVLRLFILKTHYRSPLNFNTDLLNDSKHILDKLYTAYQVAGSKDKNVTSNIIDIRSSIDWDNPYVAKFKQAMDDDFNTSLALSIIFELVTEINKTKNLDLANLLVKLANIIGLLTRTPEQYFHSGSNLSEDEINLLIIQRNEARKNKHFALADQIREELQKNGIILEDSFGLTTWKSIQ